MTHSKSVTIVVLFGVAWAFLLTMGLTACTGEKATREFVIDGHHFVVPEEFLLPSQVAWFKTPKPSGKGFGFTIDPTLPPPGQFAIGLESREITCPPDALEPGSMLASACSVNPQEQEFSDVSELRKEFTYPDNDVFWTYSTQRAGGARTIIAYCHASASPKADDTCQVFGWYADLVYSFSIEDRNFMHLGQRRAQINALLSTWERK